MVPRPPALAVSALRWHDRPTEMRVAKVVVVVVLLLVGAWRSWVVPPPAEPRDTEPRDAPAPPASMGTPEPPPGAWVLVVVPDVVGLDDGFAVDVLEGTPLRLGEVLLQPSAAPWGSVLRQSIPAGEVVRPRTRVDLVLAKGVLGALSDLRGRPGRPPRVPLCDPTSSRRCAWPRPL